jgi:hypothetical protein
MKRITLVITASVMCLALAFTTLVYVAENNLNDAIREACRAESDKEIESIMSKYGFDIQSWEGMSPSLGDKLVAVFSK